MPHTIKTKKAKAARVPSTIQFPYTDLGDGVTVGDAVLKAGGVPLTRDQLAAAMGLAPSGGGFAIKIMTAKIFGVIESVAGLWQLTELGHEILDASRRAKALVDAFLNVDLYRKVYEEFRGKRLPPRPHGLEAAFVNFGVSPKNAKAARLAFDKSARLAGMYPDANEDRLVMPVLFNVVGALTSEDLPEIAEAARREQSAPPPRALEYELVDLLKLDGIGEPESQAIWTLVRFLAAKKKPTTAK